jgi:hypothetical protein
MIYVTVMTVILTFAWLFGGSRERGPLSLVSITEELLGRNSSGSGLEYREYGLGDPLRWPRDTLYPQKLALTSPTSGGRSVGIVRFRTKAMELVSVVPGRQYFNDRSNLQTTKSVSKTSSKVLTLPSLVFT